jgi:hypothetical protein
MDFLSGKKTYIVVAVAILFNTLVQLGYLQVEHVEYVNLVLGALGLATLRAGISKTQ